MAAELQSVVSEFQSARLPKDREASLLCADCLSRADILDAYVISKLFVHGLLSLHPNSRRRINGSHDPVLTRGFTRGCAGTLALSAAASVRPDIVVAADGSGDFKTIQAAVESIPNTNRERIVVFVKDGVYHEKIRVDASFVTLRGQSRKGTRIEFPQLNDDFTRKPDNLGRAVINLNRADDFVLENLTAENTAGVIGPHAFTIYGTGDRTVIVDCDVLSDGADTVSLWLGERGRYYHANCNFRGSVDFVCPRGWCYVTNCTFYEMKNTAAVWHDGARDQDMKFVMRNCRFDGTNGWNLARHHHDAQFYFLDCTFSKTMIDRAPFRVIYPLDGTTPSEADIRRNNDLDKSNIWGERSYFYNCHREGGDYAWHTEQSFVRDQLAEAGANHRGVDVRGQVGSGTKDQSGDPARLIRQARPHHVGLQRKRHRERKAATQVAQRRISPLLLGQRHGHVEFHAAAGKS